MALEEHKAIFHGKPILERHQPVWAAEKMYNIVDAVGKFSCKEA